MAVEQAARSTPALTGDLNGIRVHLSLQGGLGNQLFQWALATSMSSKGARVTLDSVRLRGDRPPALGALAERFEHSPRWRALLLAGLHRLGLVVGHHLPSLVVETGFGFDDRLEARFRGSTYLVGYFQSFRYFTDVATDVRRSVAKAVTGDLTETGRAFRDRLATDPTTVAVHVRRGDYVSNPVAAQAHGALPIEYYRAGLQAMRELGLTSPVWFSDDMEYVQRELAARDDLVCPPGIARTDAGELALMSSCAGRIIANSSFSWWAGWLGSPGTPVIAPRRWFADRDVDLDDLLPSEWTRL